MTCYLIDDDAYVIDALETQLYKIPELIVVGKNTDPLNALNEIKSLPKVDVVFLDVNMPGLSGLELAAMLPMSIAIIFITGFMDYAYQAFERHAVDFLLKPFSFDRLHKAISKAKCYLQGSSYGSHRQIIIHQAAHGSMIQLNTYEISFIEAQDHQTCIYTKEDRVLTKFGITELLARLMHPCFLRIHRSFVVNVEMVRIIEREKVHLTSGTILPIGISYRQQVIDTFKQRL